MGLGHLRRNMLLARSLRQRSSAASILLIAGAGEAVTFGATAGIDCLTLPSLRKRADGEYCARSLNISLRQLTTIRARTISAAVEAFSPHLMIVDNVPRGAQGELTPTLLQLRRSGRTRVVLGLRDVLDAPAAVCAEWCRARNEETIGRCYDEVWVYGDPAVYDTWRECGFSEALGAKVHYTGYIDQRPRLDSAPAWIAEAAQRLSPYVLCLVGGGQDGAALAHTFAKAAAPSGVRRVLVTGPFMEAGDRLELARLAATDPMLELFEFLPEPAPLVARAESVVAMGGYNTICEVLSFRKRALIVPRVSPRREQFIRAERLHKLGLIDLLHPSILCAEALTRGIADCMTRPEPSLRLNLSGLDRIVTLADELLCNTSGRQHAMR